MREREHKGGNVVMEIDIWSKELDTGKDKIYTLMFDVQKLTSMSLSLNLIPDLPLEIC